jgi:M6 family metalloprotease-like protein
MAIRLLGLRWGAAAAAAAALLAAAGAARGEDEARTVDTAIRAKAPPARSSAWARELEGRLPFVGSLPENLVRTFDGEPLRPRPRLRVAVLPVEFPDAAHDPRFARADWERLLFSRGEYTARSPSGEAVFGSVADYYDENSCGKFRLEGRAFDWVRLERPKAYYDGLPIYAAPLFFFRAALARLEAREGPRALDGFDAVCFVCAGERGTPKQLLWPHSSVVPWRGRLLQYYLASETEGKRFCAIGVHCHELGHVLGILDKYGSAPHDGLGIWCNMATADRGDRVNGERRPLHFCAWCKMKLGWLEPATVDPGTAQTIRLRGIERSGKEAVRILVDPEGSEYFLLENRRRTGFDAGGPKPGLLIWHVGEPGASLRTGVWAYDIDLEPAHGKRRGGTHKDLDRVAWPLPGHTEFTPFTTPDSNSWNLRAREVWITGIREEGDDVVFTIGRRRAVGTF